MIFRAHLRPSVDKYLFIILPLLLFACSSRPSPTRSLPPTQPLATRTLAPTPELSHTLSPSITPANSAPPKPSLTATRTQTPSRTYAPLPSYTPTPSSTATITLPAITPIGPHPLALTRRNVGGMQLLNIFGSGSPQDLAWSPDGKILGVATGRGVWLYDGDTYAQAGFIDVGYTVSALAFSPDGKTLALAVRGEASLWSVETGEKLMGLPGKMNGIGTLVYGDSGNRVAALGAIGPDVSLQIKVMMWDTSRGSLVYSKAMEYDQTYWITISSKGDVNINKVDEFGLRCTTIKTGSIMVCYNPNGLVMITDKATGEDIRLYTIDADFDHLAVHPNLDRAAYIDYWSTSIVILNTDSLQPVQTILFDRLSDITIGAAILDGVQRNLYADFQFKKGIKIWDLASGDLLRTFPMEDEYLDDLLFSPDRRTLVVLHRGSSGGGNLIQFWDLQSAAPVYSIDIQKNSTLTYPIAFSWDGSRIASSGNGPLTELNLQTLEIRNYMNFGGFRNPSIYTPDNHLLAFRYESDGTVSLEDTVTNKKITLPYLPKSVDNYGDGVYLQSLALSADGKYLVGSTGGRETYIWDIKSRRVLSILTGHEVHGGDGWAGAVRGMAFNPQSDLLATAGYDNTIRLWDIFSGAQLRRLDVCCYAQFTDDGRYLVTSGDGVVRVWGLP